jgi:hypothetical protein
MLFYIISGVAVPRNSGFDGLNGWVTTRNRLDNTFYSTLLGNDGMVNSIFTQENQDNSAIPRFADQVLWRGGNNDGTIMLNADMALAVDFDGFLDGTTGSVTCSLTGEGTATVCPVSSLLSVAVEYANNNTLWVNDFHDAFIKMTNTGCGVGSTCNAVP